MLSRRSFLSSSLAASIAAPMGHAAPRQKPSTFIDLIHTPDLVTVYSGLDSAIALEKSGTRFGQKDVEIEFLERDSNLEVHVSSPPTP